MFGSFVNTKCLIKHTFFVILFIIFDLLQIKRKNEMCRLACFGLPEIRKDRLNSLKFVLEKIHSGIIGLNIVANALV